MIRYSRPFPSIFAFCKWSKTGGARPGNEATACIVDVTTTRYARGGHCNTVCANLQLWPGHSPPVSTLLNCQWPYDHGKNPLWPPDCSDQRNISHTYSTVYGITSKVTPLSMVFIGVSTSWCDISQHVIITWPDHHILGNWSALHHHAACWLVNTHITSLFALQFPWWKNGIRLYQHKWFWHDMSRQPRHIDMCYICTVEPLLKDSPN